MWSNIAPHMNIHQIRIVHGDSETNYSIRYIQSGNCTYMSLSIINIQMIQYLSLAYSRCSGGNELNYLRPVGISIFELI